jgi:PhnB protein
MLNLTPFLLFDGNCAEAMDFYESCFGGDLTITRVGDMPMKDQMPAEQRHQE